MEYYQKGSFPPMARGKIMYAIIRAVKKDTGVEVIWQETAKAEEKHGLFSYSELDDMRVHVDDLLARPGLYRVDLQEHKLYKSARFGDSF